MRFPDSRFILMLIFISALVIRLIFTLQSNVMPSSDAAVYDTLGLSIAEGKGYVDNNGIPHSHYPPFYPIFLSLIYASFGHSYIAVKIAQSIIGAFTCVLIYSMGKRMWNITVGAAAGFISVIYPPFIESAGLLLTELVFTFLLCLTVFYLLKIREDARLRNYIILGFLLGVTALTKSITLFLPLFVIPVFIKEVMCESTGVAAGFSLRSCTQPEGCGYRLLKERYFSAILKRWTILFLFFSLAMMPWVIRNYNAYKVFMPATADSGLNLYSSYRPAGGVFGLMASADDPVVAEANKISSPVLRARFFTEKTMDFIVNNPQKVLALEIKKILYLWAPFDWEIIGGRWFNFVYAVILPFFALGIFLALKEFSKNYIIVLPIIYFQIMTLIFYGSPRFRLPMEPFLFILAAFGVLECWRWVFYQKI